MQRPLRVSNRWGCCLTAITTFPTSCAYFRDRLKACYRGAPRPPLTTTTGQSESREVMKMPTHLPVCKTTSDNHRDNRVSIFTELSIFLAALLWAMAICQLASTSTWFEPSENSAEILYGP
jgi:hypothetical protein